MYLWNHCYYHHHRHHHFYHLICVNSSFFHTLHGVHYLASVISIESSLLYGQLIRPIILFFQAAYDLIAELYLIEKEI